MGRDLTGAQFLEGGVAGKERVTFFAGGGGGGLQFTEKNKLKFEIFNDACLCHNSKLNWEILRI